MRAYLLALMLILSSCAALDKRKKKEELRQKLEICAVSVAPMLMMMQVQVDIHQVIDYCLKLHTGQLSNQEEELTQEEELII